MILAQLLLGLVSGSVLVLAQSCQNYGISQGSGCLCPPGFGGSDCSSPACGGTMFQGSSRKTASALGNLTSAGCTCQDGWVGVGCNVCTSYTACQSGYTSQNPTNGNGVTGSDVGQNDTMVCNTAARVWAAGQMSCSVIVEFAVFLVPSMRNKPTSVESDIASNLPWFFYFKYHTNSRSLTLPHSQCDFPPHLKLSCSTALLRRRGAVFLCSGLMRAVSHRHRPLHMAMSKSRVHMHP